MYGVCKYVGRTRSTLNISILIRRRSVLAAFIWCGVIGEVSRSRLRLRTVICDM